MLGAGRGVLCRSEDGQFGRKGNELNRKCFSRKGFKNMLTEQVSSFSRSTSPVLDESPADISSDTVVETIAAHSA